MIKFIEQTDVEALAVSCDILSHFMHLVRRVRVRGAGGGV